MKTSKRQWISDIITTDDIEKWDPKYPIVISAQTGRGKSWFIMNTLYDYALKHNKNILLLTHRNNCRDQFMIELTGGRYKDQPVKLGNGIEMMNYQKLDWDHMNGFRHDIERYDFVVCDEFHYFLADASFNKTTDISFDAIIRSEKPVKIFMSATPDNMLAFMKQYKNEYGLSKYLPYWMDFDYSFICDLRFYTRDDNLDMYACQAIEQNLKVIFFIDNIENAVRIYRRYKENALFNCSKTRKEYKKYVDEEKINHMLAYQLFEENILITTTCLDCGVTLKDRAIKCIVLDVKDIDSLLQCIGRKRILDNDDEIQVFIRYYNNKVINGLKLKAQQGIEHADYLKKYGDKEYERNYLRQQDISGVVYMQDGKYHINPLMYFKRSRDVEIWKEVMYPNGQTETDKYGWCKYMSKLLGRYNEKTDKYYYGMDGHESLADYLDKLTNDKVLMLTAADRKELINKINYRANGKQLKKLKSLNSALEELKLPYMILKTDETINGKRYKAIWKVINWDWSEKMA